MEKLSGLSHLFMTVFLYNFSTFMVIPAITDVTMSALCPGEDECSIAIYLTGIQQAIMGLGTLVIMPLIGNLSDNYGRKALLTVPMSLTIIPLAILAYNRTKNYYYAYYMLKTLTSMVCEGSVHCLALAYVADNIPENRRASVFGILSGIGSSAFVCGNLSTRFLSTASTFRVSASVALIATLYMRFFLPESIVDDGASTFTNSKEEANVSLLDKPKDSKKNVRVFKTMPSFDDSVSLLRSSLTFSQAAIVAFFSNLGDVGLHAALMYYLKARFHFNKDQFADLMVISGIAGTISQMLLMPMLAPAMGEEKLLSIGLFFGCVHMFLYSIAWSSWVPYAAAMFSLLAVFAHPCLRSIASKQVGPSEQPYLKDSYLIDFFLYLSLPNMELVLRPCPSRNLTPSNGYTTSIYHGKAQGCISGLCSFANVVSPLAFSPLTALFLSASAPFHFPGFSITCAGFALVIAFVQSILIRAAPPISNFKVSNCNGMEP